MPEAEHSVTITRPRQEVFAFMDNGENDPSWRPGVKEIAHVSGEGLGAKYRQVVKGPGGRDMAGDIEVTEYDAGRIRAFVVMQGPIHPEGRYELSDADGGTHVKFSLRVDLRGPKKALAPLVSKEMRSQVQSLDRLKEVLEGQGSTGG